MSGRRHAPTRPPRDPPEPAGAIAHVPGLDGLRFLAFLLVFVFHLDIRTGIGWYGVDLFFVISGYLITGILLAIRRRGAAVLPFYQRRALRILPLYYLFLAVAVAGFDFHTGGTRALVAFATHTSNLLIGLTATWYVPMHLWTLSMEEQFYLLWPTVVGRVPLARLQRLARALVVSALLARVGAHAAGVSPTAVYTLPWFRWDTMAFGALIAIDAQRPDPVIAWLRHWRVPVLLSCLVAIAWGTDGNVVYDTGWFWPLAGFSTVVIAAGTIVIATIEGPRLAAALEWRPLRFLGKISYGLYLWNPLVHTIVDRWLGHAGMRHPPITPASVLLTLGGTIVLATLSWILFERPILSLKRRVPYGRA